jgi:flagellar basal body rod protein FlgC
MTSSFAERLQNEDSKRNATRSLPASLSGVQAYGVEQIDTPARLVYDPSHPHADAKGFVAYPGLDHAGEMALMVQTLTFTAMDPISTLNQVMLLLRQQLAEKSQRRERASSRPQTAVSAQRGLASPQDLPDHARDAIHAQIETLRVAGVSAERQLFRVAVEGLLLREFRTEVGNDPAFQQMGDWICGCLDEEPHTREMLRKFIDS